MAPLRFPEFPIGCELIGEVQECIVFLRRETSIVL
jgi:hypothetical protein